MALRGDQEPVVGAELDQASGGGSRASRAAERLRVAQPALSRVLKRIGVRPRRSSVRPAGAAEAPGSTRFGTAFLRRVDRALADDDARRELADAAGLEQGR